jgi:integral membrane protein
VKIFRITSLLEGLSYIAILSVTLGFISRDFVSSIGMTHGILFMAYVMFSLQVSHKQNWSTITWLLVFIASLIPFAFIPVEMFLRKEQEREAEASLISDTATEASASS